jgi:hypothetical protein
MPAPAAPPAAPPVAPIRVQGAPQIKSGLPNGSGIVEVPGAAVDPGPGQEPPKRGTARSRMMGDLGKIAQPDPNAPPPDPKPKPAPKTTVEPPDPGDEPTIPDTDEEPAAPAEPAADPTKPGAVDPKTGKPPKANPWKLYEAEKAARAKSEQELQEFKKNLVPEAERKTLMDRLEKAEKRSQELEEHIRFVDYEKSAEFVDKYDKPYKDAWSLAMSELKELTVNQNGQDRPFAAEDLLELVQLPLKTAIETAKQVFGDAADYVLQHRHAIKNLFEKQSNALKEARKSGLEHQTKQREAVQKWQKETESDIKTTWDKVNAEVLADEKNGSFFKPRDGDQEWNQRLAKGFAMVDRGFNENPRDPKLTKEEREAIVKRHAAIRNRAGGWGPLKHENGLLKTEIAELKKKLSGYEETAPPVGGGAPPPANGGQPTSARARMMGDLQRIAKPQ